MLGKTTTSNRELRIKVDDVDINGIVQNAIESELRISERQIVTNRIKENIEEQAKKFRNKLYFETFRSKLREDDNPIFFKLSREKITSMKELGSTN